MGIFKFFKQLLSQETAKPVRAKASKVRIKTGGVSISGLSDEALRKQASQYYDKNKDKIATARKAVRERNRTKSKESRGEQTRKYVEKTLIEFKSISCKEYVVSTSGDGRVCAACKKHDGKKYAVQDAICGKNAPPFCDECRCCILPVM